MSEAPREVSPEEYREMVTAGKVKTRSNTITINRSFVTTAAIVVVSLLIGFYIGTDYQKSKTPSSNGTSATTNGGTSQNGFGGQRGFRRGAGAIGQVTAVSDSSITVNNQRRGSAQTFKITSSTTVTNNGVSASVSDIKTGDTVLIRTSTSDTGTATSILINPSFGGPGGLNGPSPSDGSSSSTNSIDAPDSSSSDSSTTSTI